ACADLSLFSLRRGDQLEVWSSTVSTRGPAWRRSRGRTEAAGGDVLSVPTTLGNAPSAALAAVLGDSFDAPHARHGPSHRNFVAEAMLEGVAARPMPVWAAIGDMVTAGVRSPPAAGVSRVLVESPRQRVRIWSGCRVLR